MTPAEVREQARARKAALRAQLARTRNEARARLGEVPAVKEARRRRRRRLGRAAAVAALVLLALLLQCRCQGEALAPAPPAAGAPEPQGKPAARAAPPRPVKPGPLAGTLKGRPRGAFQGEASAAPPWLDTFRLQVAARSPRLARCFQGVERPGALRWSVAVDAASGAVSDGTLEPVGAGGSLGPVQRACVFGVLTTPGYRLPSGGSAALPSRVGLLLEF
jgi:hypothetical protein